MSESIDTDSVTHSGSSGGHPLDDYLRNVQANDVDHDHARNPLDFARDTTSSSGEEEHGDSEGEEEREGEGEGEAEGREKSDDEEGRAGRSSRDTGANGTATSPSSAHVVKKIPSLSLPPPLQSLDADVGTVPTGIILVSNEDEMGNTHSLEYRKMLRPTRYFDDEAFDEPGGSSILCFKCGLVGHMAKDCKNPPKLRPCYLCAGYGHASASCPQQACYRCGEVGHQARDCTGGRLEPWQEALTNICKRCGKGEGDCYAAVGGDLQRAEGRCTGAYDRADLTKVTCLACGKPGHANCAALATTEATKSCFNCGEVGHLGSECRSAPNAAVSAERRRSVHALRGRGGGGAGRSGGAGRGGWGSGGGHRGHGGRGKGRGGAPARPMERDRGLGVRRTQQTKHKPVPMKKGVWRR